MNHNTAYLIKLYFLYKDSTDYLVSRLALHEDSYKVICHTCRIFYISNYNCTTSVIQNVFRIECHKCKGVTSVILEEDEEEEEEEIDLLFL